METPISCETAKHISTLTAAALEVKKIGNCSHLVVPAGFNIADLTTVVEKANPQPARKAGTVQLGNVPSLLQYMADQAQGAQAYVYANVDARTITAVFNDQRKKDLPGWRDHRAAYKAEHTPEFALWMANNKRPFSQTEFAEFIEDNITDLNGEDAALLLSVATTIQASTGINFASSKRLQDGQTQLVYNETIDATAGATGEMKIPQKFVLGLRIFKNGDGYKLSARLKFRLGGGSVKFHYELERPERAVEDAFNGYVDQIRADKSGYTVLIGTP